MSSFMKIRPVAAKLFRRDGQTDMTKLTVAFPNFAKVPKNSQEIPSSYETTRFITVLRKHLLVRYWHCGPTISIQRPPINLTPRPYLRVIRRSVPWVTWVVIAGVEGARHTLAKGALLYPSQGGRYRAEGPIALG